MILNECDLTIDNERIEDFAMILNELTTCNIY